MSSDLTNALTQIVSSLMELIAKTKQTNLQPEAPKIKKTPEMTYHQFLRTVLAGRQPLSVSGKKMSYRLQQDLQLLLELSDHNQISQKTFQTIVNSKKINRTLQSLKSRYHDYLYKIEERQMKKIVNWIQKQGLDGYLIFQGNQMIIQKNQPKQTRRQIPQEAEVKKPRPASLQKQQKKIEKAAKATKLGHILGDCKQLNQVLKIYSKMVGVSVKQLLAWLDQVSGDLILLDSYVETKDVRLLWTPQQDQILKRNDNLEINILRKYRGSALEVRKRYLGL